MDYILAVDSGGTKCDAALATSGGRILRFNHSVIRGVGGRTPRSVGGAISGMAHDFPADLGNLHIVAGYGSVIPSFSLPGGKAVQATIHFVAERDAPMLLAGVEYGIVALAGTGAVIFFKGRDGRESRFDGLGPLLGDYGGAYHIGLLGLRAAMKSPWHERHRTSLAAALLPLYEAKALGDLVALNFSNPDRSVIAAAAAVVNREAEKGDEVSRRILEEAAETHFQTFKDMVETLGLQGEQYPVVGTGSVMRKSRIFWELFSARVKEYAPGLKPERLTLPAVAGLVIEAAVRLGGNSGEVRKAVFESAEAVIEN